MTRTMIDAEERASVRACAPRGLIGAFPIGSATAPARAVRSVFKP